MMAIAAKRKNKMFDPTSDQPYKISRSKIELFMECPRCFYLDRRLGVSRPPGFPFNLNSAVDRLLKREFDQYRVQQKPHPIMASNQVDAVPYQHEQLDEWRNNFKGMRHLHQPTNLIIQGAVDDIWVTPAGDLIVVDYKATSKSSAINIDAPWQQSYKRQMEVYQWLLRQLGFTVSPIGYFVYCNGNAQADGFNNRLEFEVSLLPYTGADQWIEPTLQDIYQTLRGEQPPAAGSSCIFCGYRRIVQRILPNEQ